MHSMEPVANKNINNKHVETYQSAWSHCDLHRATQSVMMKLDRSEWAREQRRVDQSTVSEPVATYI